MKQCNSLFYKHFRTLATLVTGCLLGIANSHAAIIINQTQRIDFGTLVFVAGTCDMDTSTGNLTNIGSKDICADSSGDVGTYQITATANTVVTVTVHRHANDGDGVEYTPAGQLTSSAGTTTIIPNNPVTINSGATGIIQLRLGGRLVFLSNITPSTIYLKPFQIDYTE